MGQAASLQELIAVLEDARALLALPDNEFLWSPWTNAGEALEEIDALLDELKQGALPKKDALEILFAPTGPMQEVSVSSGWDEEFLALAARFDTVVDAIG
jgi:hypothetical protein